MAPQSASIQSFFPPQSSQSSPNAGASAHVAPSSLNSAAFVPGDGFTSSELAVVPALPLSVPFAAPHGTPYEDVAIAILGPTQRRVTFTGRVVNLYGLSVKGMNSAPRAAKGCLRMVVRDGEAAVTVRLWYADVAYPLRLGSLVTVWTTHVAVSEHDRLAPSAASLCTSIFPERDRGCHVQIHDPGPENERRYRKPLGYGGGGRSAQMPGLMTLAAFASGGCEVPDVKVLVCVKSIGVRKKVTKKDNSTSDNLTVHVFDHTTEASITLWDAATASAALWRPSHTVLLLTSPGFRGNVSKTWLTLNGNTYVDVDPEIRDAEWLRGFAQRMLKRQHCNPPFPGDVFDPDEILEAQNRILYTFADMDGFARTAPTEKLVGYVSAIITELNLVHLHRRNMLACTECACGHPLYANATLTTCPHCDKPDIPLALNPRLLGPVIDETGGIAAGKLLFAPWAWAQLLGRTPEQLLHGGVEVLRYLEERLLFVRVSLLVGWVGGEDGGVGRVCVVGVRV